MSLVFGEELMGFNSFVINEFKDEKCSWTHPMKLVWFVGYDECKKEMFVNLWVATKDEFTKEKVECSTFLQLMNLEKKSL